MNNGTTQPTILKLASFLRINKKADLAYIASIIGAFFIVSQISILPHYSRFSDLQFALYRQVLSGTAPAPYQWEMFYLCHALEYLLHFSVKGNANLFFHFYMTYYLISTGIFLILLYRLCRRVASPLASTISCLYLMAIYHLFVCDNYFHPSDQIGIILTVFIMEALMDYPRNYKSYFLLLFLSGLVWEKAFFIPLGWLIMRLWREKINTHLILSAFGETLTASTLAILGQAVIWLYFSPPFELSNFSLILSLRIYFFFGITIFFVFLNSSFTSLIFRCMSLQLLFWFLLYWSIGGGLVEMRSMFVLVPCLWPGMALGIDRIFHSTRTKIKIIV